MFLIVGNRVIFKFYKWHPGTYERDEPDTAIMSFRMKAIDVIREKKMNKYQGICPIARKTVFPRNTGAKLRYLTVRCRFSTSPSSLKYEP